MLGLPLWALAGLAGAGTGLAVGIIGYYANSKEEKFDIHKFIPTIIVGTGAGLIEGIIAPDVKAAVIAALVADKVTRAVKQYNALPKP